MKYLKRFNESNYWYHDYIKGAKEAFFSKEDIEELLSEFNDAPRTSENPGFVVSVKEQSPIKWSKNETEEQMISTARQIMRFGYLYKYIVEIDSFSEGRQDNYHFRYDYNDQSKLTEDMFESLYRLVNTLQQKGWEYKCKVVFADTPNDSHVEKPRDMIIKDGWLEAKLLQDKNLYRLEPGDGVFHIELELIRWSTNEK